MKISAAPDQKIAPNLVSRPVLHTDMIPVYRPFLRGNERKYVMDCVDSGWISSNGTYVRRFEESLEATAQVAHAVSVCNGTAALHLALHCLDIGSGDEVIVPTFTYIASVTAITQTGATPVFCDSRESDWLIDPDKIECLITARTKAILCVHLYGAVCDMKAICAIAEKHGLKVVEDCAECLGSTRDDKHPGTFGDAGTLSFFGNKTITTGEGGAVLTMNSSLAARLAKVKNQGMSISVRYWHDELGFNYRMTNIAAAIGLGQMEMFHQILARKRVIAARYDHLIQGLPVTPQRLDPGVVSSAWLFSILLPPGVNRTRIMASMAERNVETRPLFYCAHQMPAYANANLSHLPVAEDIAKRGLSLPSFPGLKRVEQERVVDALTAALHNA